MKNVKLLIQCLCCIPYVCTFSKASRMHTGRGWSSPSSSNSMSVAWSLNEMVYVHIRAIL